MPCRRIFARAVPDDLSPLEARRAPPEIEPLVTSFNDLLTRLEQNMELQKRFIADAAHQMKTPLAGLRTQAELALRQDVSAEVHRSLEQIATSSEHAARLVTQLLALARAENRMSGQIFTPVEVTEVARSAVRDWVQAALAKQMDLGYEAPEEPVEVDGNPVMLREMLSNLIDNAIRYTPAGRADHRAGAARRDGAARASGSGGHRTRHSGGRALAGGRALLPDSRPRRRRQRPRACDRPRDHDDARRGDDDRR